MRFVWDEKAQKQWIKERNAAIRTLDVDVFKQFYRKWQVRGIYDKKPMPSDEVLEIAIYKMALAIHPMSEDVRRKARNWLKEHHCSENSKN